MSVLFINACVRERSRTMKLAQHFLDGLNDEVHEINLQNEGIKPLDGKALLLRDKLVGNGNTDHPLIRYARDFSKADMIVIAAPYWDLMFPALLKIYLEAVTVCGVTFKYDENGVPRGLCRAGQLVYITTAGGSVNRDFGFLYVKELAETFYGIKQTICFKKEFQTLWNYINHKYAYTVEFDSEELIRKAIAHIDDKMFVAKLQYTVTTGEQEQNLDAEELKSGAGFTAEKSQSFTLERSESSSVRYDVIGKIAAGAKLTRRSTAKILSGIRSDTFAMLKNNPEEFIAKAIRLINEQKSTMIVEQITYNQTAEKYDSTIFTAEKNTDFSRAYLAKKNVQDYVFTDGYAKDGKSVERRFAEDMDKAEEVCVYAKLPKGFSIPTPVGNYSPDWAIAFNKGTVKHIFFIAETKGTMETLNLKPIEKAKIDCAKKLFNSLSTADVVYDSVDSYQHLLDIM